MLAATSNDVQVLWIILAILCFLAALYFAHLGNYVGMVGAGFIGVVVVVLTVA